MWIDLYVLTALLAAVAVWLVTPHFQSDDPPGDIARGFWSAAAGALWPLVLVGALQIYAVRLIVRRLRPAVPEQPAPVRRLALPDASLRA